MPAIIVTNTGDLDIDDTMGGFSLLDSDGKVLFSTGYTSMVTGSVWLASGQLMHLGLYITEAAQDRNPYIMRLWTGRNAEFDIRGLPDQWFSFTGRLFFFDCSFNG